MRQEWKNILLVYFANEGYGTELLGQFLHGIMTEKKNFSKFFFHVIDGEFYQYYESHFIHMPKNLIEERLYEGCIEISWDNFDGVERVGKVRLDKFCFYTKLAAVFHAKYVNQKFDPWEGFKKLDAMQQRYGDKETM